MSRRVAAMEAGSELSGTGCKASPAGCCICKSVRQGAAMRHDCSIVTILLYETLQNRPTVF